MEICTPSLLRRDRQTEAFVHPRSQIGVDRGQVAFDRALLDEALDALAQVPDDVADQMVPVGRRHHLAVERAGLDEVVVVLVRRIGRAHDLGGLHKPARIAVALRSRPVGRRSCSARRPAGSHCAGSASGRPCCSCAPR